MSRILKQKDVKTRKPHQCFGCARKFPAGSKLEYRVEVNDSNELWYGYLCDVCIEMEYSMEYGDEYSCGELRQCQPEEWEAKRKELEGDTNES